MQPAGQDPEARLAPGTVTVPLCPRANASPFWIMSLLVSGRTNHAMFLVRRRISGRHRRRLASYFLYRLPVIARHFHVLAVAIAWRHMRGLRPASGTDSVEQLTHKTERIDLVVMFAGRETQ